MDKNSDLIKVGTFNPKFNEVLQTDIDSVDIYRSKGLSAHMIKRKHFKCLKYLDYLSDIIDNPDYIGVNPNEKEISIELIKRYKDNVIVGIKLDSSKEYMYVSTLYDLQESKIARRLHSGRIKRFIVEK